MDEVDIDFDEYEETLTENMFYVEKELGVYIDDDYPLAKFNAQVYYLNKHVENEKQELEKANRR